MYMAPKCGSLLSTSYLRCHSNDDVHGQRPDVESMDLGWLVNHSNPNLQQDVGGGGGKVKKVSNLKQLIEQEFCEDEKTM